LLFLLSLPFGFLTTAILFSNEVPDCEVDSKAGKMTWVSLTGRNNAFLIYYLLLICGFLAILFSVHIGYLRSIALISLLLIFPGIKAAGILQKSHSDKTKLMVSSKLTIIIQAAVSIILIASIIL